MVVCWEKLLAGPLTTALPDPQDLSEAVSMVQLQQELGLQTLDSQREVFLLAASVAPTGPGFENPGTVHIWRLLLELLS